MYTVIMTTTRCSTVQCNLIIGEKEKAKHYFHKVYQHTSDQELKHRAHAYLELLHPLKQR